MEGQTLQQKPVNPFNRLFIFLTFEHANGNTGVHTRGGSKE